MMVCVPCVIFILASFWRHGVNAGDMEDVLKRLDGLEDRERSYIATVSELTQRLAIQDDRILQLERDAKRKDATIDRLGRRFDALAKSKLYTDAKGRTDGLKPTGLRQDSGVGIGQANDIGVNDIPNHHGDGVNRTTNPYDQSTPMIQQQQKKQKGISSRKRLLVDSDEVSDGDISTSPVAFHAVINPLANVPESHDHNEPVVFERVLLDLGGGYHESVGMFIAPVAGVYVFSASLTTHGGEKTTVWGALKKNDVTLARIYGHGDVNFHNQGSVTLAVELSVGDEVYVTTYIGRSSLWGNRYTSFSGFLLA